MPFNDDFDETIAPFDDDKPKDELVAEEEGWTQKRYDEMESKFSELSEDEIETFVDGFVDLPQPTQEMTKQDIFKIIAEHHSYADVVERFDEI